MRRLMGRLFSLSTCRRRPKLVRIFIGFLCLVAYTQFVHLFSGTSPSAASSQPRILLVTALFPLEHSKHSQDDYQSWLSNFLGPHGIDCDIYFYTTSTVAPIISSLHASSTRAFPHTLTINTTYNNPFMVPPLVPHRDKYVQMHAWDRERSYHNPELYAVWNAKSALLAGALSTLNSKAEASGGEKYSYAFWNDAGSFRDRHDFGVWPDPKRVDEVFEEGSRATGENKSDLIFFPLLKIPGPDEKKWSFERGPVDMDFSEGSFFGGTPTAISWFARTFYAQHDHYIKTSPTSAEKHLHPHPGHPHAPPPPPPPPNDGASQPPFHFVGKDQTLINSVLFRYPSRFFGVYSPLRAGELPPTQLPGPMLTLSRIPFIARLRVRMAQFLVKWKEARGEKCVDEWYYYQWWLAGNRGRRETEKVRDWKRWKTSWFEGSEGCEESLVVSVERLLEGLFGSSWVSRTRAGKEDWV